MTDVLKYCKTLVLSIQNSMEYRLNFFLSLFSCVFPIVIQYFLWSSVYGSSGKVLVSGYTYSQMMAYVVLAGLVSKLMVTGLAHEVSGDIKNGGLNKFIVQPIGYFPYRVCYFLGQKLLQMGILLVVIFGILATLNITMEFPVELSRLALFIPAVVLGLILNFMIFFSLSTIAFWMAEVWGIFATFRLISNIASGGIFPIDLFGQKVQAIFHFLPFQYVIYFQINILNGKMKPDSIFAGFGHQLLWIAAFSLLAGFLWKCGMKKYIAVGG